MTTLSTTEPVVTPALQTSAVTRVLISLSLWFFVAIGLGLSGVLGGPDHPPIGLGAAIGLPLLAFAVDGWLGRPAFRAIADLPLPTLIAVQTYRIGGIFFLVAWAQGALPGAFALPAGLGDVAIGLLAPFVAAAVARRSPGHRTVALAWNVAGLVDLATAIFLGVTHAGGPLGIFASDPTTAALARYPFSLIPTFLVPIALILHTLALRTIRRMSPAT